MTRGDRNFFKVLAAIAVVYVGLLLAMVLANLTLVASDSASAWATLARAEIQQAILLSLGIAYLVSRQQFYGRRLVDFLMDLPIFLPPLVIGISLLILFRRTPLSALDSALGIAFYVPAIVLAQTVVGVAFVYRTMKATFDTISKRQERIAQSLGCSRFSAFCKITLPQSRQGLVTAAAIAWARSFGEFGPVLVFAGSIRGRTEVMPVSIYLELNSGNLSGAVLIALLMIVIAAVVLLVTRVVADGRRGGAQ